MRDGALGLVGEFVQLSFKVLCPLISEVTKAGLKNPKYWNMLGRKGPLDALGAPFQSTFKASNMP